MKSLMKICYLARMFQTNKTSLLLQAAFLYSFRSKSDVSILQSELDRFFSTMGMDDSLKSPLPDAQDTLFTTAPFGSESDFSFAGNFFKILKVFSSILPKVTYD